MFPVTALACINQQVPRNSLGIYGLGKMSPISVPCVSQDSDNIYSIHNCNSQQAFGSGFYGMIKENRLASEDHVAGKGLQQEEKWLFTLEFVAFNEEH